MTGTGNRALLPGIPVPAHSLGISAIADTGASHILLREEDSFLLTNIQRCKENQPFATLKTANGSVFKATGRGNFIIAKVVVEAFIFQNNDLAANLLGVIPFSNLGCTAVFRPHWFGIYPQHDKTPIVVGTRASAESLWVVDLAQFIPHADLGHSDGIPPPCPTDPGVYIEANAIALHDNASYVKFVHACLGYLTPSTFLRAVMAGYITGLHQFPRLTPKMVRKYIPNAMPTAKGHLDRRPSALPHAESDSISARLRHHSRETRNKNVRFADTHMQLDTASLSDDAAFVRTHANRSTRMHMDYTEAMPERYSAGTLFFQVSVWGGYINLQPLRSMRSEHTVPAFEAAVNFYRHHGATIDTIRMDNQRSQPLIQMACSLDMKMELVTPYVKNPNRAERAIRTAKNHIISTRAGFHPHCPHMYLDKCLMQIEMTLNITRPFEFDHAISAYEGLFGVKFNFKQHPIAPVGTKVLTWDAPDHRGSWADHGVEAAYLGPAIEHLRSFEVWVPNTSAPRITNTVWWFLHDLAPDDALLSADTNLMYPPSKARPFPMDDGSDLIGRAFLEPELGICLLTGQGPVTYKQMSTRAVARRNNSTNDPLIVTGSHYTLTYKQIDTGEVNFSSLTEILFWIESGPLLQPPESHQPITNATNAPVTTPPCVPASLQYIPRTQLPLPVSQPSPEVPNVGPKANPKRLVQ